jgi:CheY-like chemotaxis protein
MGILCRKRLVSEIFRTFTKIRLPYSMSANVKKKILLAEDDDSMRRFIEITLNRAGYETISAKDGLEALKIAFENEIDAVVADAIMPNMSGFDLCRMMRQNPQFEKIPFVLLSGLENSADGIAADAYLLKDSNLKDELTGTLAKLLV